MVFSPLENFRHFLSSRPPLVVFVVCIGMTAIAFISYAYYIKYNDVYNPDADEKFNQIMLNVTKLNLCTKLSNDSWNVNFAKKGDLVNLTDVMQNDEETKLDLSKYQSLSFLMTVTVSFLPTEGNLFPRPVTYFVSKYPASLLGISGVHENKSIAMEMVPGAPLNLKCGDDKLVCLAEYQMCVTILVPDGAIPYSRQRQPSNTCHFPKTNTSSSFIAWLDVSAPTHTKTDHSVSNCESNILLRAAYEKERLTVMLTLEKRSLVNMHLMHSSYFLFVIIITILLFGIIVGGGERKYPKSHINHYTVVSTP